MSLSNTVENQLLTALLALYPNRYIALSTADPGETGAGIAEPSTGGYVRQSVGAVTLSGSTVTNDDPATFPVASVSWGSIGWVALYSAETSGTFIGSVAIVAFDCAASTRVIIPSGTTILSLD
jgi:hypothetical protein